MATTRIPSLDSFRGLAIVFMVAANFVSGNSRVPAILKHRADAGLTPFDLVAPQFLFAIGMTPTAAFARRASCGGTGHAYIATARRYFALLGLGALLCECAHFAGQPSAPIAWVLQSISIAGLCSLPFARASASTRLLAGAVLLIAYQIMFGGSASEVVFRSENGGLPGSLAWAGMLALSTGVADVWHRESHGLPWRTPLLTVTLLPVGICLSAVVPISKHRVSCTYVLVSTAASAMLFLLLDNAHRRFGWREGRLAMWGKNPLLLDLLHPMLIGLVGAPPASWLYRHAPLWLGYTGERTPLETLSAVHARHVEAIPLREPQPVPRLAGPAGSRRAAGQDDPRRPRRILL